MPQFKVPQKVEHDYFGVGQTIAYDSSSRKYTVQFGECPVIKRRCSEADLSECKLSTGNQLILEVFCDK